MPRLNLIDIQNKFARGSEERGYLPVLLRGPRRHVERQDDGRSRSEIRVAVVALFGSDFDVTLKPGQSAYDLEKGQPVTVKFVLRQQAECMSPFKGDNGETIKLGTATWFPLATGH